MVEVYVDGSCNNRTGIGGWAWALYKSGKLTVHSSGSAVGTTSNRMEITAMLQALSYLGLTLEPPARVFSDSKYVVKGLTLWVHSWRLGDWKVAAQRGIENLDLWKELYLAHYEHTQGVHQIKWVKGHSGVPGNVKVDLLASMARKHRETLEVSHVKVE